MYLLLIKGHRQPIPKYKEIRRNGAWDEHVTKCLYKRGEFQRRYHMSIEAFRREGNLGFTTIPYETNEVISTARQRAIVEQLRQKTIQRLVYNIQTNMNEA